MTDREEQIYQKIEVIGISLQRGLKKFKIREYVMAETYFKGAIAEIQRLQNFLNNRKGD